MGWMWSRGGDFASGLLGSVVAGDPVWPSGRSSSLLSLSPLALDAIGDPSSLMTQGERASRGP
jgi:hypothetical protein